MPLSTRYAISLALALATPARAAVACQGVHADSARTGGVTGTVLDAASGQALTGAVVVLVPRPDGVLTPAVARTSFWASGASALTSVDGAYRFARVAPGEYRLYVRRLGYEPTTLDVDLRQAGELRLSVGLVVQPILLAPSTVTLVRAPFGRDVTPDAANRGERVDAELLRQERYLGTDARTLTHADVVEAVTLGETDLFRAFQRMPGVTTRDDFTAELWTRGAPWSQTRVYFDGLPLFNPVHTVGVFTGINPDAVGSVYFLPGARSAAVGEGAAAVLDITSRGGEQGRVAGTGELSVVSVRGSLDGGLGDRGDWMVAARRSYIDLISPIVADSANAVPYDFLDLTGRADYALGKAGTLAISGLWERDDVRGDVRDLLRGNTGFWGNAIGQATFTTQVGTLLVRQSVGVSRFDGNVQIRTLAAASASDTLRSFVTSAPTSNGLTYLSARTLIQPRSGGDDTWSAGLDLVSQRQSYDGPLPRPYPSAILFDTLRLHTTLATPAAWGEVRRRLGAVSVAGGARVDVPSDGRPVALLPRVNVRWAVTPTVSLSMGAARSMQYTQAVAPAGPGVGPDLHLTDVWLMSNDTIPAVRADIVTAGGEAWLSGGWLGAVNVYGRRSIGVAVPDPAPGTLNVTRPIFVAGVNRAAGIEFSLRRLAGPWTGSLAYSLSTSRMEAGGLEYAASADRRHVLDVTGMASVSPALRIGGAVTAASGAPYSRFLLQRAVPCDTGGTLCEIVTAARDLEAPDANRTGPYLSADLLLDWSHAFRGWRLSAYLQLRNVIDRRNAVTYLGSYEACTPGPGDIVPRAGVCDRFDRGVPPLPLVGISVSF